MAIKKPLVIYDGEIGQLQTGDTIEGGGGGGSLTAGEVDGDPLDSGITTILLGTSTNQIVFNDAVNGVSYWFVDDPPPTIAGAILTQTGTTLYTARESDGNTNYEVAAGSLNSYTIIDGIFVLSVPSFRNGDTSELTVELNGVTIATADLSANFVELDRAGNQDMNLYDIQGTGDPITNGVVAFVGGAAGYGNLTLNSVGWTAGIEASPYQQCTAEINITSSSLWRQGYNYIRVTHNALNSGSYVLFWDSDVGADPSASGVNLTLVSASLKYLSGVPYYGAGSTFESDAIVDDAFDNVYHSTEAVVVISGFPGVSSYALPITHGTVSNISSPPAISESMIVTNYPFTVIAGQEDEDVRVSYAPRDPYGSYAATLSASNGVSIMSYGNTSTVLLDLFQDEVYRFTRTFNFNVAPTGVGTVGDWTSSAALTNGNLQVYDEIGTTKNELYYPQDDYSSGRLPVGPNHSAGFAGNCEYIRCFYGSFDNTNGIIRVPGITDADLASNVLIDIKVPTKTMWLRVNTAYNPGTFTVNATYPTGSDGEGCRINSGVHSPDIDNSLEFTLGSFACDASVNYGLYVRITYPSAIPRYLNGSSGGFGLTNW